VTDYSEGHFPKKLSIARESRKNHSWLFRTSRAMGAFLQNLLSEDWLSERVQENQSTLIAQLSTGSAEEPTIGMVSEHLYVYNYRDPRASINSIQHAFELAFQRFFLFECNYSRRLILCYFYQVLGGNSS